MNYTGAFNTGISFENNQIFDDNFIVEPKTKTAEVKNDKDIIDVFVDVSKNTKDLIVDETKTIAPAIAETMKTSTERLNSEKRIIEAIPNSYFYYGLIILGLSIVFRKSL
jgi:hypothetical protein